MTDYKTYRYALQDAIRLLERVRDNGPRYQQAKLDAIILDLEILTREA